MARFNRQQLLKARNVVIVGLALGDRNTDLEIANTFFCEVGVGAAVIKSVHRLSSSKKINAASNSNMLLVTLEAGRQEVLAKCGRHCLKGKYERVFVREDRTPGEQDEFNRARAVMKLKNDELLKAGRLDHPYRYVLHKRQGRPVCIDVIQSGQQKRYVFANPSAAALRSQLENRGHDGLNNNAGRGRERGGAHANDQLNNNEYGDYDNVNEDKWRSSWQLRCILQQQQGVW